jgi:hypothetical protein
LFSGFRKERERRKAGEQMLLLPLPRASRGRRRLTVLFKTTMFWLFFFLTVNETTSFHLKEKRH